MNLTKSEQIEMQRHALNIQARRKAGLRTTDGYNKTKTRKIAKIAKELEGLTKPLKNN